MTTRTGFHTHSIEFKGSFQSGKHNSLGYGGKIPEQKKQGEYRIIFLGGSTVRFG